MSDDQPAQQPPPPTPSEGSGDASPAEPTPIPDGRSTRGRVIALAIGGLLLLLLLGLVVGVLVDGGGDETTTASDEDSSSTGEETTTTERPTTTQPPTTTTTLPGFDDGTHLIPAEIAPGRWSTKGRTYCHFARLSGLGGTPDQIIGTTTGGGGPGIVDIAPTDAAFESRECERWTLYATPAAPVTTFGPGDWAVRGDIVPGTYRADAVIECYWECATGFAHAGDEVIEFGHPIQEATVVIAPGDNRFSPAQAAAPGPRSPET